MATHSIRRHLRVEIAAYDAMIRRFTPGYETMLEVIAGALTASGPDHVLDLGAGTGALSEAILAHDGAQTVGADRPGSGNARSGPSAARDPPPMVVPVLMRELHSY